ncbi:hypothetical protein FACS1894218_4700 [Bacilli bacterium]|nr:hypothetical protein FACS1894218_4700 [Bacilli bacterium]
MYEDINGAINNVNKNQIEMANVFKVSKRNQFKLVYLPIALPYIFSAMVMAFGLCFKITIASQFVQQIVSKVPPSSYYPSIGIMIMNAITAGKFDVLIA